MFLILAGVMLFPLGLLGLLLVMANLEDSLDDPAASGSQPLRDASVVPGRSETASAGPPAPA